MPRLRNDRFTREGARGDTLASMVPANTLVNDVHSGLNATNVCGIHQPISIDALREVIMLAASRGESVAVCGSRHAMGGQQFLSNAQLIDMRSKFFEHYPEFSWPKYYPSNPQTHNR